MIKGQIKKLSPRIDIYQVTNKPNEVISTPPMSSHFQAIKTNNNRPSQGAAFGLFLITPIIPPPKLSAPEKSAKTNKSDPKLNRVYLAIFRNILAALI